jgi:hypothetical protein
MRNVYLRSVWQTALRCALASLCASDAPVTGGALSVALRGGEGCS